MGKSRLTGFLLQYIMPCSMDTLRKIHESFKKNSPAWGWVSVGLLGVSGVISSGIAIVDATVLNSSELATLNCINGLGLIAASVILMGIQLAREKSGK